MTPDQAASVQYDILDSEDVARVDTREAFISGYRAALTNTGRYESMRHEAAALDGLASNGPAQAYALGYQAGRVEASAQQAATAVESTSAELEAFALGGYTAEQEARADAIAAASRCFQASLSTTEGDDDLIYVTQGIQELARSFAHYIEHGEPRSTLDEHATLDIVQGDRDLGDRVDQALDAAKMAQPRTRPTSQT